MKILHACLALAGFSLAPAAPHAAQSLALDKIGGANPGLTTLELSQGTPGQLYLVIAAASETSTLLPTGATLAVPLDLLWITFQLPGFVGLLGASGSASASFPLDGDPTLLGTTLSFQALQGPLFDQASNLLRVTPAAPGSFTATLGTPALPIAGGAVAAGSNGSLLLVGGSGPVAQTYDSRLEEFELGGATFGVGLLSQATALADGRILFSGGLGQGGQPTQDAALYDPATETTTTLSMNLPRAGHGAALLGNGKVLISGGFAAFNLTDILSLLLGVQNTTEFFDPTTQSFTAGPNMLEARALHTATSLSNGGALVAGGLSVIPIISLPTVSATAYEYSASLNSFGLPKLMNGGRLLHSAVKLGNGKVLLAGGLSADFTEVLATGDLTKLKIGTLKDCQLYNPGFFGGFSTVSGLASGRAGAGMAPLGGNGALIAGGFEFVLDPADPTATAFNLLASADVYDGSALAPTGAMAAGRLLPVLWPLSDGNVLVLGGGPLAAETYQP